MLTIWHMNNLKSIWPNQVAPNSFCKLRDIYINRCDSLNYVFPSSVFKELRQLQHLEICNCICIKHIVEESDSCDMPFVYLKKLTVSHCFKMKTIFPSSVIYQSLDELYVFNCNGLVNIITPSTTTCLPKLRILSIMSCYELEEIYGSRKEDDGPLELGEIAFMKLEKLKLLNLPWLRGFCQGSYDFKFPSLQLVDLDERTLMETFCHGNLKTPSLVKVLYEWNGKDEDHWDGDLNTTIASIFTQYNSQGESQEEEEEEEEE